MKISWKLMNKHWGGFTLAACVVVAFYVGLTHLGTIAGGVRAVVHFCQPVIVGAVIAYIMNPLVRYMQRTLFGKLRSRRVAGGLSVLLTVLIVLIVLAVLLGMLIPQLVTSIGGFVDNLDTYVASLQRFVNALGLQSEELEKTLSELVSDENGLLQQVVNMITKNIGRVLQVSSSIGGQAINWVISFIFAIYLLVDKTRLARAMRDFFALVLPDRTYEQAGGVWKRFNEIFSRYIVCEIVDALIVGVSNYLFMLATGMPYALLISAVVGVANLAPTFGPIVGAALGGFILLLVNPVLVLWFLGFTIILQAIDGYLLKPKMFGDALNVPSILILASIIIGGRMFGMIGILLAIPCAALLEYIYHDLIAPWLRVRKALRRAMPAGELAVAVDDEETEDESERESENEN